MAYIPMEEPLYETAAIDLSPIYPSMMNQARISTAVPFTPTKTIVRRRRAPLMGDQALLMPNALEETLAQENRALYEKQLNQRTQLWRLEQE